jgi:hypothetical protein
VESWVRQDYDGPKELLICNDKPDQELVCDVEGVRVWNFDKKFATLGGKYNWMFNQARGEYVTPWEDDDIFLPHRISAAVDALESRDLDYYKIPWAYYVNNGMITGTTANLFYCSGMWRRSLLQRTTMCDEVQANADQTIERKLQDACDPERYLIDELESPERIFYMYMWGGRTAHLSGWGSDPGALEAAQAILDKESPTGTVHVIPGYDHDYEGMCRKWREKQ